MPTTTMARHEFTAIYYGNCFVVRETSTGDDNAGPHPCLRKLFGPHTRRFLLQTPRQLHRAIQTIYDITALVEFDRPAREGVWPAMHERAERVNALPVQACTINTVFGNASYQPDSGNVQIMGCRSFRYVVAAARLVHAGHVEGVQLQRFGVDDSLGCMVQVSHACFLERVTVALFPGVATVVPRTEELSNAVLLHIEHAGLFLRRAREKGLAERPSTQDTSTQHTRHPPVTGSRGAEAAVSVQVTRTGHVKLRLSWCRALCFEPDADLCAAEDELLTLAGELMAVLRHMC